MHEYQLQDVARKFLGTVANVTRKDTNENMWAYVSQVEGDPENLTVKIIPRDGNELNLITFKGEFHYVRPVCGYLSTPDGAIHLRRRMGGKNWQIGLSNGNSVITEYCKEENQKGWMFALPKVDKDLTHPVYLFDPATEKRRFVALSRLFMLDKRTKNIFGINQKVAASFLDADKLVMHNPLLKQELQDLINRRNLPWKIE